MNQIQDSGVGYVGKVLAPTTPGRAVPLIKWIEISVALQNVIFFLKIVITANKNKYIYKKCRLRMNNKQTK